MRGAAALLVLAACGGGAGSPVAVVRVDDGLELADAERQIAERYYAEHPDDRDQLIIWDTGDQNFGLLSYLPVANDVTGIGWRHVGFEQDLFDIAADYGSANLRGMIWIGSRWRRIADDGQRDSALGIMTTESPHLWGAMVHSDDGGGDSDRLLSSDGLHWSGLVDAGDSPFGGNHWQDLGGGQYQRVADAADTASDLDLYLMGLLPADQVGPVTLLTDVSVGVCAQPSPCADGWRDGPPDVVDATPVAVGVDQVIAAEGPRDPAAGATELRQGWIYAVHGDAEPDPDDLDRLEQLRQRWPVLYGSVTRGLGSVVTE